MADNEPVAPKTNKLLGEDQELDLVNNFSVQFWGVRDKIPTPGLESMRYGGNTPCLLVQVAGKQLIFDGGSGLRLLGNSLKTQIPLEAHIFFTNCYWEHIQGFPFFIPAFIPPNHLHLYSAGTPKGYSLQECLALQMSTPNFPVPLEAMAAKKSFYSLEDNETVVLGEVAVRSTILNKNNNSVAYRITWQSYSVVYATSYPDYDQSYADLKLVQLVSDADLLIINAPQGITSASLKNSAWYKSIQLAKAAQVRNIMVSSYSPEHDDRFLRQMEGQLHKMFSPLTFAREGVVIKLIEKQ